MTLLWNYILTDKAERHYNEQKAGENMDKAIQFPFLGIRPTSIFRDQSVEGSRRMICRSSHGFIMKIEGVTEYRSESETWMLEAGKILFVRKGSSYSIREITQGHSCVINFDGAVDCPYNMAMLTLPANFDPAAAAGRLFYNWQKERLYAASAVLNEILDHTDKMRKSYVSSKERRLLQGASDYLQNNLTDPDLKPEMLVSFTNVSETYFRKLFKKQYGLPPSTYIIVQRIKLAKKLLENGEEETIAAVAQRCGYRDPLYFSRLFKKWVGLSPREYAQIQENQRF